MNPLDKSSHRSALCPCPCPTPCSRVFFGRGWMAVPFPWCWARRQVTPCAFALLQIDAFQHMQHFVQTMQQQAQHAIATEDQQHKQELHKLMARWAPYGQAYHTPTLPHQRPLPHGHGQGSQSSQLLASLSPFPGLHSLCHLFSQDPIAQEHPCAVLLVSSFRVDS